MTTQYADVPEGQLFSKSTLIQGRPRLTACIRLDDQTFQVSGGPLTIVRLEDEWYEDLHDPARIVEKLLEVRSVRPDLLTFWQRLPDIEPKYSFHQEWEDLAILPITSYEHWWNNQIKSRIRSLIRKSTKEGLEVRATTYDDDFVKGMTAIFNETPVRQGRRFWHYGKDVETIRAQFSRFVFREQMIGAYLGNEMIGFVMLGDAGTFGITGQIISSIRHRDKAPNNALIAKSVEICAARGLTHLCYFSWDDGSLAEFKRRCGFERIRVPRYYVPLSWKGSAALRFGVHRGWNAMIPSGIKNSLKRYRTIWHEFRAQ